MNKRGFANIIFVLVIIMIGGAVGYFALMRKPTPTVQQMPTTSQTQTPITQQPTSITQTSSSEIATWKTYRNNQFEISYPPDWTVNEEWSELAQQSIVSMSGKAGEVSIFPRGIYEGGDIDLSDCRKSNIILSDKSAKITRCFQGGTDIFFGDVLFKPALTEWPNFAIAIRGEDTSATKLINNILSTFKFVR